MWYAGNRNARIGRLDPDSGDIVTFPMPDPAAGDPHTLVFGSDNDIWFTVQQGHFVGRLDRGSDAVQLIPVLTPRARPTASSTPPDNRPWIVLLGTNKLATVDPDTLALEEVALPRSGARPRRLEITADGAIWYVDYAQGVPGSLPARRQDLPGVAAAGRRRLETLRHRPRSPGSHLDRRDRLPAQRSGRLRSDHRELRRRPGHPQRRIGAAHVLPRTDPGDLVRGRYRLSG